MLHVTLADQFRSVPVTTVAVTISGIEYECLCGYPSGAQQLLVHLNRLFDNHYLSFERALKADMKDGPKSDDFNNRMAHLTPVLAKAERVTVSRNEKIIDKGEVSTRLTLTRARCSVSQLRFRHVLHLQILFWAQTD